MKGPGVLNEDDEFAAGFILNKLYTMKCFGRVGNKSHNRHTELANMPKSFPRNRGIIVPTCYRMRNILVMIFKSNGEDHICALHEEDAMVIGLALCNKYRAKVGLPPLDKFLKESKPLAEETKKTEWVPLTDKEKRTKAYYEENIKKWIGEKGLS